MIKPETKPATKALLPLQDRQQPQGQGLRLRPYPEAVSSLFFSLFISASISISLHTETMSVLFRLVVFRVSALFASLDPFICCRFRYMSRRMGTSLWMAPELLNGGMPTTMSDTVKINLRLS
jgi:hypothetical protein